jgi:hypothetical protein
MLVKKFNNDDIYIHINHLKIITLMESYSGVCNKNKY